MYNIYIIRTEKIINDSLKCKTCIVRACCCDRQFLIEYYDGLPDATDKQIKRQIRRYKDCLK